jgi:hypothetical protein
VVAKELKRYTELGGVHSSLLCIELAIARRLSLYLEFGPAIHIGLGCTKEHVQNISSVLAEA